MEHLSFHPSGTSLFVMCQDGPVEIGGIQSFGGIPGGNTLTVICTADPANTGQRILETAAHQHSQQFKMVFKDGGKDRFSPSRLFAGIVRSAVSTLDQTNWEMKLAAQIEIVGTMTKISA